MDNQLSAARDFILRQGRLLDRRLFATCFEGAPAAGVIEALRGYRNGDGGFGHGLEPDKRCPASLRIDVEIALQALATAGTVDQPMVVSACDYLAKVAACVDRGGAVPLAFPVIEAYPRAEHWTDWTYEPALNPTAGLVGLTRQLRVDHAWVDAAADWCWEQLAAAELPADAHALREVLVFLEHAPERDRANAIAGKVRDQLGAASWFRLDPDDSGYGLSPLSIAPAADSRWRVLFSEDVLEAHLDRLERGQQPDGGGRTRGEPPRGAPRREWRGAVTVDALRPLVSYGRLSPKG